MNASAGSTYVVLRSLSGEHIVVEKGTSEWKLLKDSSVEVCRGSMSDCQNYRTVGDKIRQKYGVSRTLLRLAKRRGLSVQEYRNARKIRKMEEKAEQRKKKARIRANRKVRVPKVTKTTKKHK